MGSQGGIGDLGKITRNLGTVGGVVTGGLQTLYDLWSASEENRLADIGRKGLSEQAAPFTQAMGTNAISTTTGANRAQTLGTINTAKGLSGMASAMFGTPSNQSSSAYSNNLPQNPMLAKLLSASNTEGGATTPDVTPEDFLAMKQWGETERQAAIEQAQKDIAAAGTNIESGETVAQRGATRIAQEGLTSATDYETQRVKEIADKAAAQEADMARRADEGQATARADLDTTRTELKDNLATLTDLVKSGIATSTANFNETLTYLKDTAAQALIGTGAQVNSEMTAAISDLTKQLTGDPNRDAMIQKQIAVTKQQYSAKLGSELKAARTDADNFTATVRTTASKNMEDSVANFTQTLASGQANYGANLNTAVNNYQSFVADTNKTLASGQVALSSVVSNASNQASQVIAQARSQGQALIGQAYFGDINNWASMQTQAVGLVQQAAGEAVERENNLGNAVATIISGATQLSTQALMSYVNPNIAQADFMKGSLAVYNMGYQDMQLDLQRDMYEAQNNQATNSLGLSAASMAIPNVGFGGKTAGGTNWAMGF